MRGIKKFEEFLAEHSLNFANPSKIVKLPQKAL